MIVSRFTYSLLFIVTICLIAATGGSDDREANSPTNRSVNDNPLINGQESLESLLEYHNIAPEKREAMITIMSDIAESEGDTLASVEKLKKKPSFKSFRELWASLTLNLLTSNGGGASTSANVSHPRNSSEQNDEDSETLQHSTQNTQDLSTQSENAGTRNEQNQFDERTPSNKPERYNVQQGTTMKMIGVTNYTRKTTTRAQLGPREDDRVEVRSENYDGRTKAERIGLEFIMPEVLRLGDIQQVHQEDGESDQFMSQPFDHENDRIELYDSSLQTHQSQPPSFEPDFAAQRNESPKQSRRSSASAGSVYSQQHDATPQIHEKINSEVYRDYDPGDIQSSTDMAETSDSDPFIISPERIAIAKKLSSLDTQHKSGLTNGFGSEYMSDSQEYQDACDEDEELEGGSVVAMLEFTTAKKDEVMESVRKADPKANIIVPRGPHQKRARALFNELQ